MPPSKQNKKHQKPATEQSGQGTSKGKQPMSKPVYANPRFFVAHIPVKRDAPIKRISISISPSTAVRHPQTFFFKNIPNVGPYWGWENDEATTAQRIVRLKPDGNAAPYFLMVCRGEYPKVRSSRNDNEIFAGLHEPIFGDAFVFKLGDPELYGDGYARYVHIEEGIGGVDWLREAVRDAAKKVENAMAHEANPGFPDLTTYADAETRLKDSATMISWMKKIEKAGARQESTLSADVKAGLPDVERMKDVFKEWTQDAVRWGGEGSIPWDKKPKWKEVQTVQSFLRKVQDAEAVVENAISAKAAKAINRHVSAHTIIRQPKVKTATAVQNANDAFLAIRHAFTEVEAIAKGEASLVRLAFHGGPESSGGTNNSANDYTAFKNHVNQMLPQLESWKEKHVVPPEVDDTLTKARAFLQALEEGKGDAEIEKAARELEEPYEKMRRRLDGQDVVLRADSSSSKAGAVQES